MQRLDRPYIRGAEGKLKECSWDSAFFKITEAVNLTNKNDIAAIAGNLVDVESTFLLKSLMNALGWTHLFW